MSNIIFLDASFFIAVANVEDDYHRLAGDVFDELYASGRKFITTDYVICEVFTWMRCKQKMPVKDVIRFGANIRVSRMDLFGITDEIFYDALDSLIKYDDQDFSFTDCVSFTVMNDLKIRDVLTTDKHFVIAGFNNLLKV